MENNQSNTETNNNETVKPNGSESYFTFIQETLKRPDDIITKDFKGYHQYGIINICIFLAVILLDSIMVRISLFDDLGWYFSNFFTYLERILAYGIAMAALIAFWNWYCNKEVKRYDINFFLEKFGALMIFPSLLILISIPLELLDIDIHSWISYMAFTFLYISVFVVSYLVASKNRLQVASITVIGFYFVYRLLSTIF